ncbi:hypothetical protein [Escherichia coli]|uniref:hypothetical protein n=1 Tax=Escherichia coli TaxID=562 RepID=UPI000B7EE9E6|nr:hypothetical protein [Escherichia coli]EEX1850662.1 hypothetical protein [Escherichia coli]EHI1080817.1 hypothetical protein [Escherichia coli]EIZ4146074.1 hypothetical protein [Escherichia coli]
MRSSIKVHGGKKVVINNGISLSNYAFVMASEVDLLEVNNSVSFSKGTPFHIDSCNVFNAHTNLDLGINSPIKRYVEHGFEKRRFFLSKICIFVLEFIHEE